MAAKESTRAATASRQARKPEAPRNSGADAFVVLAMTLTTVALAIGLYLQFRLAFWLAVIAALSVYIGLLALHALVRRSERVEHLSEEVARLKAELEDAQGRWPDQVGDEARDTALQAGRAPAQSMPASRAAIGSQSDTGSVLSPATVPAGGPASAKAGAISTSGRNVKPGPLPPSTPATTAVAASLRDAGMATVEPRVSAPVAVTPPPLPQSIRAAPAAMSTIPPAVDLNPGRSSDVMGDYWAYRPQQAPLLRDGPAAQRPLDAGMRDEGMTGPSLHDPMSRDPKRPPLDMGTFAGRNLGGTALSTGVAPPHVLAAAQSRSAEGAHSRDASGSPKPPQMPAASAQAQPGPGQSANAAARAASPREADVEMIQGLIKKLADEVNAAEAGMLAKPAPASRVPAAAIEASVNALRTTADTMRAPGKPASQASKQDKPSHSDTAAATPAVAQKARSEQQPPFAGSSTSVPGAPGLAVRGPKASQDNSAAREGHDVKRSTLLRQPEPHIPAAASAPAFSSPPPIPAPRAEVLATPVTHHQPSPPGREQPAANVQDAAEMLPADVSSQETLLATVAHSKLAALAEAITAGRLDVLLEPILGLADQRARHFEVSVRLKDKNGQVLDPPESVPELRESGLLPLLDCARIGRTAQVARRLSDRGKPGSLFSAFSGEALGHDQFLADFTDAYVAREGLAEQLVLAFSQSDVRGFAGRDLETLAEMRELGFRFSVQSVTDLDMDFEALKAAGFDFVKLDATVFLDGMPASGGIIPPADICRHLAQLGMTLIVGQIDDEAHLARIFGFGVIYGQGQLFGGARPMKSEALADASTVAA